MLYLNPLLLLYTMAITLTGYSVSAVAVEDVCGASNKEGSTRKFPVVETD